MRSRLLLVATLAAACATPVRSEHVLTGVARQAWAGAVKVVMDGAPAPGAYDEVAIVNATGTAGNATLPAVIGALQDEARSLGCNAVIRVRYDHGAQSASATGVAVWIN
jgi:hypothetical protein